MPQRPTTSIVKRWATRLAGPGPRSVQPLATILDAFGPDRADWGWCGPERIWGPMARFRAPAFAYPPADHAGAPVHEVLEGTPRFRDPFVAAEHDCVAFALPDAGAVGQDGLIYHVPTRTAVRETTVQWWGDGETNSLLHAPRLAPAQRRQGAAVCLRCLGASFYHVMIEGLSRLVVLRDLVDQAQHVLVSAEEAPWAIAWIERAGIPREKVVFCRGDTHLVFDTLYFATPFLREQQPTPAHVAALTKLYFGDVTPSDPARAKREIYLSRKDAGSRQWAGEDAFIAANPEIEVVTLAGLSPGAQRDLFASATTIVGVHGANLANIAFCGPLFTVIELFPERGYAPMYYRWAHAAGGQHVAVHLTGSPEQQAQDATDALRTALARGVF